MEIKRIKEESYESIEVYLNEMMSMVSRFSDLCFVDHKDKRYMIGIGDDKFAIIENNKGELNPYYLSFPDPMVEKYGTEEYTYDIVTQSDLKEVVRKSTINEDCERLSFLPRIENCPKDIIEYIQFIDSLDASLLRTFDVTQRADLKSGLVFCNYHEPDVMRVEVLKKFLLLYRKKTYHYCLGLNDDFYYQPLFAMGDLLVGTKRQKYQSKEFLDEICERGFNRNIPYELSSILTGDNETHKTLKLVVENYQNYIKEQ